MVRAESDSCSHRTVPSIREVVRCRRARPATALIVVIFIAAVFERCVGVAADYVTRDEAFSWRLIHYSLPEMLSRAAEDVHPPLYYLALKGWSTLFGRSMVSLRCMSILLAVGTIPLLMATVREACDLSCRGHNESAKVGNAGAMLAAALFAVHTSQVYPARDARMYSLGVFLAVLSSWLLLRSLCSDRVVFKWWLAYGIAVGAFCHTHNFAFFTIAGQCVFVLGDSIRQAASGRRGVASRQALGFVFAGMVALVIYLPWVPSLLHQIHEVSESYWIPAVTGPETLRVLASWGGGAATISYEGGSGFVTGLDMGVWLFAIVLLVIATFAIRHRGMWLFLLQAAVPWGLSLGISVLGDRPIFHERYLIFAQVFLLGLWGVMFERVRDVALRVCLIWFLAMTVIYNSLSTLTQIPWQSAPAKQAMQFVKDRYDREGDVVIAASYRQVNQLRYHASEIEMEGTIILAIGTLPVYAGHTTHIASLSDSDFIRQEDWRSNKYRRIWYISELFQAGANQMPPGMEEIERRVFTREGGTRALMNEDEYRVALYGRKQDSGSKH